MRIALDPIERREQMNEIIPSPHAQHLAVFQRHSVEAVRHVQYRTPTVIVGRTSNTRTPAELGHASSLLEYLRAPPHIATHLPKSPPPITHTHTSMWSTKHFTSLLPKRLASPRITPRLSSRNMSSPTQQPPTNPSSAHQDQNQQPPTDAQPANTTTQTPLPLPSPSDASTATTLNVNGDGVKLDHLGPLVVNKDGSLSRIANWEKMAEIERSNTLRILGKRNQLRLEGLRGAEAAGKEGE
jgi:hypothetical protein